MSRVRELFEPNFVSNDFVVKLIAMWTVIGSSQKLVLSGEIEDVYPQFGVGLQSFLESGFFSFQRIPKSDFKNRLSLISNNQTFDDSDECFSDEEWIAPNSNDELFQMIRSRSDRYRANFTLFLVSEKFPDRRHIDGVIRMTCPGNALHEILLAYDWYGSAWQFSYPQSVQIFNSPLL